LSLGIAIFVQRKYAYIPNIHPSSVDRAYDQYVMRPILQISNLTAFLDNRLIDRTIHRFVYLQVILAKIAGLSDRYLVDGVVTTTAALVRSTGNLFRSAGLGRIQGYLIWAFIGFILMVIWIIR
jgi:hypothetical protein